MSTSRDVIFGAGQVGSHLARILELATAGQRRGLSLFVVGSLLNCVSWVPLMVAPQSQWSMSWLGFVAPAYTPLVWLVGLGLVGRRLYVQTPFK